MKTRYVIYIISILSGVLILIGGALYYYKTSPDLSFRLNASLHETSKMTILSYSITAIAFISFLTSLFTIHKIRKFTPKNKLLNNSLYGLSILLVLVFAIQLIYFFIPTVNSIKMLNVDTENRDEQLLWPEFKNELPGK